MRPPSWCLERWLFRHWQEGHLRFHLSLRATPHLSVYTILFWLCFTFLPPCVWRPVILTFRCANGRLDPYVMSAVINSKRDFKFIELEGRDRAHSTDWLHQIDLLHAVVVDLLWDSLAEPCKGRAEVLRGVRGLGFLCFLCLGWFCYLLILWHRNRRDRHWIGTWAKIRVHRMFRWDFKLVLGCLNRLRHWRFLLSLCLFCSMHSLGRRLDADRDCWCPLSAGCWQGWFRNRHRRLLSWHPVLSGLGGEVCGALAWLEETQHLTREDVLFCCWLLQYASLLLSVLWRGLYEWVVYTGKWSERKVFPVWAGLTIRS